MNLKNLDDLDTNGNVGDWCFLNNTKNIAIRYGKIAFAGTVVIPISTKPIAGDGNWTWNGDVNNPTLSPSILVKPVDGFSEGWHGYLRSGILETV